MQEKSPVVNQRALQNLDVPVFAFPLTWTDLRLLLLRRILLNGDDDSDLFANPRLDLLQVRDLLAEMLRKNSIDLIARQSNVDMHDSLLLGLLVKWTLFRKILLSKFL